MGVAVRGGPGGWRGPGRRAGLGGAGQPGDPGSAGSSQLSGVWRSPQVAWPACCRLIPIVTRPA